MTGLAGLKPQHFLWDVKDRIATVRLNRPERKNPLSFESYAELRDTFRALAYADDVDIVVFAPNGGNFCSGGDVHDIIGPLIGLDMKGLLAFTGLDSLHAWDPAARPVPVSGSMAASAALDDDATALVIDVCGPVRHVVQGADLAGLASRQ